MYQSTHEKQGTSTSRAVANQVSPKTIIGSFRDEREILQRQRELSQVIQKVPINAGGILEFFDPDIPAYLKLIGFEVRPGGTNRTKYRILRTGREFYYVPETGTYLTLDEIPIDPSQLITPEELLAYSGGDGDDGPPPGAGAIAILKEVTPRLIRCCTGETAVLLPCPFADTLLVLLQALARGDIKALTGHTEELVELINVLSRLTDISWKTLVSTTELKSLGASGEEEQKIYVLSRVASRLIEVAFIRLNQREIGDIEGDADEGNEVIAEERYVQALQGHKDWEGVIELGEMLSGGHEHNGEKTVFALVGQDGLVLAIQTNNMPDSISMQQEFQLLQEAFPEEGLPTISVMCFGKYDGFPAMIMRRAEITSKYMVRIKGKKAERYTPHPTSGKKDYMEYARDHLKPGVSLESIQHIKTVLLKRKIAIPDLQFLLLEGEFLVHDPNGILRNGDEGFKQTQESNFLLLNAFVEVIRELGLEEAANSDGNDSSEYSDEDEIPTYAEVAATILQEIQAIEKEMYRKPKGKQNNLWRDIRDSSFYYIVLMDQFFGIAENRESYPNAYAKYQWDRENWTGFEDER